MLEVYGRLLAEHPELRLVLAPRYVERTPKLAAMAREAGYAVRLRSEGALGPGDEPPRVVLLDTIGELSAAYRLATLVFVGGSFTNRGGQNILEPAAQGRPVLFGPNMENFHDSVEVLLGHGGIQVSDPERLYQVASELLAHPRKVEELGQRALEAVLAVRGASARNVARMAAALDGKGRGGRR